MTTSAFGSHLGGSEGDGRMELPVAQPALDLLAALARRRQLGGQSLGAVGAPAPTG